MFKFSSAEETCHLSPLNMCARQNRSYIHDLLRGSLLVTAPDSWSKGCEFESRQKQRENFLLRVIFACWLLFDVRCTPMLPQWHVKKNPSHSARSADDWLHLNTHTSLTQRSRSGLTMPLSRHSVGTYKGKRAQTQLVRGAKRKPPLDT